MSSNLLWAMPSSDGDDLVSCEYVCYSLSYFSICGDLFIKSYFILAKNKLKKLIIPNCFLDTLFCQRIFNTYVAIISGHLWIYHVRVLVREVCPITLDEISFGWLSIIT